LRRRAETLYELEALFAEEGWPSEEFVYDDEHDLYRFPDGEFASNTNPMLSPVGMAEPSDQLANLRTACTRAFAASTSRFLGGALVCSEASSMLEAAAISSTVA
jgi:hypothetical protein